MSDKRRPLEKSDTYSSAAIKCYEEQLPKGEEALVNAIKTVPKDELKIIAIKHYKSSEKAHWHIIVSCPGKKSERIKKTLERLCIVFRDGIDDKLWYHHGVERTGTYGGDYAKYAKYLLHQTEAAISEGKAPYEKTDFVTNLSDEDIDKILAGERLVTKKNNNYSYNDLAREAGYNLENFDEFIKGLGLPNLTADAERRIRSCYLSGAERRARGHEKVRRFLMHVLVENNEMMEICTRAAEKALSDKRITSGVTGESLLIEPDTEAIVTYLDANDSNKMKILYSLSDEHITAIGKNREKQVWAGNTIIVVTRVEKLERNERYFCCEIKDGKLQCKSAPKICLSNDEVEEYTTTFRLFKEKFDKYIAEYMESFSGNTIDLDVLNS